MTTDRPKKTFIIIVIMNMTTTTAADTTTTTIVYTEGHTNRHSTEQGHIKKVKVKLGYITVCSKA